MDAVKVLRAQFAQVLGEILSLQDELASGGLTVTGSRGHPVSNPLIGEVRAHRYLLLQMAVMLRRDGGDGVIEIPDEDEIDRLRREWEEGL